MLYIWIFRSHRVTVSVRITSLSFGHTQGTASPDLFGKWRTYTTIYSEHILHKSKNSGGLVGGIGM